MGEGWCDNPSGSRPNFFGRQHLTFDKGGKGVGNFRGIVRKRRSRWGNVGAVKALLLYYEHHFDEYRKLNIKNPLFIVNGGFLCLGGVWCGARDGSTAIPPVVARIFSGDSTSPLTREASLVRSEG